MYRSLVSVLVHNGFGWLLIAVPSPDAPYAWATVAMAALLFKRARRLGIAAHMVLEWVCFGRLARVLLGYIGRIWVRLTGNMAFPRGDFVVGCIHGSRQCSCRVRVC